MNTSGHRRIGASGQKHAGFTMIELALYISLLGLMAAAFLSTMNFTAGSLDRATRKIAADLKYAQQLAYSNEGVYGLRATSATTYEVYVGAPGTPATDPYTQGAMTLNLATNYAGVTFNNAAYRIEFGATGLPTIGGGTQILLSQAGTTRTVTITATTGYVTVP